VGKDYRPLGGEMKTLGPGGLNPPPPSGNWGLGLLEGFRIDPE